jgi:hypothetical protein
MKKHLLFFTLLLVFIASNFELALCKSRVKSPEEIEAKPEELIPPSALEIDVSTEDDLYKRPVSNFTSYFYLNEKHNF